VLAFNDAKGEYFEKWFAIEVVEHEGTICHAYDDGTFLVAGGGRSLWVGPLIPPPLPNDRSSATGGNDV
jgi:hypothetical protein